MTAIVTKEAMQAATSFLLGRLHTGLWLILESETSDSYKIRQLEDLEATLRKEIERLYYPNPVSSET